MILSILTTLLILFYTWSVCEIFSNSNGLIECMHLSIPFEQFEKFLENGNNNSLIYSLPLSETVYLSLLVILHTFSLTKIDL
jgi:hypothetical protein